MRTLLLAVVSALLGAAPASAQAPTLMFTDDGRAVLGGAESWRICPPDEECTTMTGGFLRLPLAAGTRVEGIVGGAVVRTGTWNGPPVAVALPVVVGPAVTGELVGAQAGTWNGGWGDEVDGPVSVVACRAPDAVVGCRTLNTPLAQPGRFLIDMDLAGMYLRVIHRRLARDGTAAGGSAVVSRSVAVPIAAGQPRVELRRRVMRFSGGYGVGHVRCWPTCTVAISATGKRNAQHTFVARGAKRALVFPRSAKLRPGLLRVRVTVDGVVRADGFVRLVR